MKNSTVELFAYKNTASSAGSPTRLDINVNEVIAVNRWVNHYGNPSYVFHMSNGDTYFTVDNYRVCHSWFTDIHIKSVKRKKDMFNRFA